LLLIMINLDTIREWYLFDLIQYIFYSPKSMYLMSATLS